MLGHANLQLVFQILNKNLKRGGPAEDIFHNNPCPSPKIKHNSFGPSQVLVCHIYVMNKHHKNNRTIDWTKRHDIESVLCVFGAREG